MKKYLITVFVLSVFACNAQNTRTQSKFEKAKTEFNLVTTKDFPTLNCSETINRKKMLHFFETYPQFGEDVRIVSIPNCYGAANEKFFVLLYDENKKFYVPKSLPDVYKNDDSWPRTKVGGN